MAGKLEVSNSIFEDCRNSAIETIGPDGYPLAYATITNCSFRNCEAYYSGGAITIDGCQDAVITDCLFEGNRAGVGGTYGAGGAILSGAWPTGATRIERNVFLNNGVVGIGSGGAISVNSRAVISGNTFYGSYHLGTSREGSTMDLAPVGFPMTVSNNVIAHSLGGAAIGVYLGPATFSCNVLWDNPAGHIQGDTLSGTDRIVDPLFCDAPNGVLTVSDQSPCLPPNSIGCRLIGAFGQGCGTISVQDASWGRIKALYR